MIDRDDGGSATGRALLKRSDAPSWGWHRVADGDRCWDDFLRWGHLLGGEGYLWRFLAGGGVEPTNTTAERAMRHGVLWRKSSGRTASEWGSRFVSRLLGVVGTCRQRGRSMLEFLASCFEASVRSQPVPSLIRP